MSGKKAADGGENKKIGLYGSSLTLFNLLTPACHSRLLLVYMVKFFTIFLRPPRRIFALLMYYAAADNESEARCRIFFICGIYLQCRDSWGKRNLFIRAGGGGVGGKASREMSFTRDTLTFRFFFIAKTFFCIFLMR